MQRLLIPQEHGFLEKKGAILKLPKINLLHRKAKPEGLRIVITYARVETEEDMTQKSILRTWGMITKKTMSMLEEIAKKEEERDKMSNVKHLLPSSPATGQISGTESNQSTKEAPTWVWGHLRSHC